MENINTTHSIIIGAAQNMEQLKDNSIELVVTSPPYPMIKMWDEIMAKQNPEVQTALDIMTVQKHLSLCTWNWTRFGQKLEGF